MLQRITRNLIKGSKAFSRITPNPIFLIKSPIILPALLAQHIVTNIIKRKPAHNIIGETIGYTSIGYLGGNGLSNLLRRGIHTSYYATAKPWNSINGVGGRSEFIIRPEVLARNKRIIQHMVIVYHHANKAGKHIDVHIGRRSLVYRITGKPVESKIKFNNKGLLTAESKEALLEHLRNEIKNNSRVAQNIDHSLTNAKISWPYDPTLVNQAGYGSGPTRQIITEEDVEFYHPSVHTSLHLYAPSINPDQGLYMYQLYPGDSKRAPIAIFGTLEPLPEAHYHDRLHLNLIQPEDFQSKFINKIDKFTTTRKYDGASTYFSSNGQGFKFFSPRMSTATGKQIEYTYNIPELANLGHPSKPVGMAELLFYKRTVLGDLLAALKIKGPEGLAWNYIPAASIGGILNSNSIRPRDTYPDLRVYRMDKWAGKDTYNLPFFENRQLQLQMISDLKGYWDIVRLTKPVQNSKTLGWEGFVGVPEGMSVNNGLKVKWWDDPFDWQVISNELSLSEKGNIKGVIWFKSLESGKEFKLGPGNIGSFDDCMELMSLGNDIIGRVAKVHGRQGHEGRAAKLVEWHMDK